MRKLFLLLLCVICAVAAQSQNYNSNRSKAEKIKADTAYYWYHGNADFETIDDAIDHSIAGLLNNIKREHKSHVINIAGDISAQMDAVFNTFEPFLKQEYQYLILMEGDDNECFTYVAKEKFRMACEERKSEINYYVEMGNAAYEKENVGDAMRFYFIALMLCYSHPDGNELQYRDLETGKEVKLSKWLDNRINSEDGILNSVRFNVKNWTKKDKVSTVELRVSTVDDVSITNMNIKYNNGHFNEVTNVNNGKAEIVIEGETDDVLKSANVEIDLFGYNDISEQPAVIMMKFLKRKLKFGRAVKTIYNRIDTPKPEINRNIDDKNIEKYIVTDDIFINNMRKIETAIRNNDYESVKNLFSADGYENYFMKLKAYGKVSVIGTPDYKLFNFRNEVICRSVPMRFGFNNNSFTHDVVFRFDAKTKLVTSIAFRLSDIAEEGVWNRREWNPDSRVTLINFLEDYQTAYAFKQLNYLQKIFSDDALIIVGHVVEYKPISTDGKIFGNNTKVERTKKTKKEYLDDLERQFKKKNYINIHFTDLEVKKSSGDEEIFGVQVRQYYYSNDYCDEGYLFLMVDLREELPIIHVRTWQPGKTDINDLITLKDIL